MYCESCSDVCFQNFSVVFGHFLKASCAKHFFGYKIKFLRKMSLNFGLKLTELRTTQYPLRMSMLTICNINDVNDVVLVSLLLTVDIF